MLSGKAGVPPSVLEAVNAAKNHDSVCANGVELGLEGITYESSI
jgi:hypothetical protein